MNIVAFDIGVRNFAMAWVQDSNTTTPTVCNMDLVDLSAIKSTHRSLNLYRQLILYLESIDWIFKEHSPCILIEQQMAVKHKTNIQALKLSQHVLAYFLHRHPHLNILEYSARLKTKVFSFYDRSYKGRKQWAVEKTRQLLLDDPVSQDWFEQFKKKDDVADCVVMALSFLHNNKKTNSSFAAADDAAS